MSDIHLKMCSIQLKHDLVIVILALKRRTSVNLPIFKNTNIEF